VTLATSTLGLFIIRCVEQRCDNLLAGKNVEMSLLNVWYLHYCLCVVWHVHYCIVCWQWNLVCNKNYLVETSESVFNFGVMVGAIIFTSLADRLGRKPIHLACQYSMLVLGLAIVFSPNYIVFVVLRFFLGAMREVNITASFRKNVCSKAKQEGWLSPTERASAG